MEINTRVSEGCTSRKEDVTESKKKPVQYMIYRYTKEHLRDTSIHKERREDIKLLGVHKREKGDC